MISDNQTEMFFKDGLRDYHSAVPADMWNRIIEKNKRDRKIFLFFSRLFAVIILSLALAGGYFIISPKKSVPDIGMDYLKINHKPTISDTHKASLSKLPSSQDQMRATQADSSNKKANPKEKGRENELENLADTEINGPEKITSSQVGDANNNFSIPVDSMDINESKTENKNDSLDKKLFVKAPITDSSQGNVFKKPEPVKKHHNGKWWLDLYASPDYPIVSPHENEQSKLSYTIGIKLNRSLGNRFSVKTGIQYGQVNISGYDSLFSGRTLHLRRLDLPVLAGYSMGSDNIKTTINGGIIFNLYTWLQGNAAPGFFKTNTGLSLYLGVNFETGINEKFSLFGEPYYRYQLTSMTVSSVNSAKFIEVVGVSIGARYFFKK